jgi:hypothetical protein
VTDQLFSAEEVPPLAWGSGLSMAILHIYITKHSGKNIFSTSVCMRAWEPPVFGVKLAAVLSDIDMKNKSFYYLSGMSALTRTVLPVIY